MLTHHTNTHVHTQTQTRAHTYTHAHSHLHFDIGDNFCNYVSIEAMAKARPKFMTHIVIQFQRLIASITSLEHSNNYEHIECLLKQSY